MGKRLNRLWHAASAAIGAVVVALPVINDQIPELTRMLPQSKPIKAAGTVVGIAMLVTASWDRIRGKVAAPSAERKEAVADQPAGEVKGA